MKLQNTFLSLVSIMMLLGLAGCAHYRAKPLAKLHTTCPSAPAAICDETITMAYKVFTKKDCMRYLDRNVLKKGYQPIHIAINNNTDKSLVFSTTNIDMISVLPEEVAERVYTNTVGRVVGYGATGVALSIASTGVAFVVPYFLPFYLVPAAFQIAAIVDGVGSAKANKRLDRDFMRKSLQDQTITPYGTINGLIFVPVDLFDENDLSITLFDAKEGTPFVLTVDNPRLKLVSNTSKQIIL